MRRSLAIAISVVLLTLASVSVGAITNGDEDVDNLYPYVGMLAFYVDVDAEEYSHRCSGTLISSTVIVTASHCTDGTLTARAYFDIEVTDDFRENPSGTGLVGTSHTHPNYSPLTLNNDVGVVVLEEEAGVAEPYPTLPEEGLLAEMRSDHEIQDETFVTVGYGGVPGFPPSVIEFDLIRRFAVTPYGALLPNNLKLHQNPNVNDAGGTCFGDSGGPHFLGDSMVLVSVTSWGDAICRANDMTQRLDLASALDFIDGFGE